MLKLINDPIKRFQGVQLIRQATLFLATILIARSSLTLEEIGFFEWLTYLGYVCSYFWAAGFLQGLLAGKDDPNNAYTPSFISSVFWMFLLGAILVFSIFLVASFTVDSLHEYRINYILFGGWMLMNLPGMMLPYLLFIRVKNTQLVYFNFFFLFGYLINFLLLIVFQWGITELLIGLNIFVAIQLVWLIKLLSNAGKITFEIAEIKQLLVKFSPLVGYALMGGLAIVFDGWLVQFLHNDPEIFAIFRYGAREFPLGIAMTAALSNALIPMLSRSIAEGLPEIRKRSWKLMHVLGVLMIILLLFSGPLYHLMYGDRFTESVPLFDTMLLLFLSRLLFPQTVLLALRENRLLFFVSILELIINILLSIFLFYTFGLIGIVLATVIAFGFEKIIYILYLRSKYGLSWKTYTHINWWMFYSMVLITLYIIKYTVW